MKNNKVQNNIPIGWQQVKLGDIGEFKNGVNKSKEKFGHGSPFVNLMDIFGYPSIRNKRFGLVEVNSSEIKNYNLKKGDILFVRSSVKPNGVGLATLIEEDLINTVFSGFIIRYRTDESIIYHGFKKYAFQNSIFRSKLIACSSISANTNINQEALNKLIVFLPSLQEQNRIVSVLETWDKAIEKLTKKIEFKKNIKKCLMQRLLTGKLRLSGFSKPWSHIKIRDLAGLVKGDKSKGGDNGYLEIGDVDINSKSYNIIGKEKLTVPGAIKVPCGTLLISTVRPTRGAITITKESIFVSSAFCKLKIDNFFTYFIVNSETFLNYLGDNSGGGTYPTCKNEDVLEYEFLAPAVVEERIAIANILKTAEQEVEVLEHKLNCFKQQKTYLLNNLIIGAIRTPETMKIKS